MADTETIKELAATVAPDTKRADRGTTLALDAADQAFQARVLMISNTLHAELLDKDEDAPERARNGVANARKTWLSMRAAILASVEQ